MPRTARQASNSNVYHVTARGAGRRRIFEDDEDRRFFTNKLYKLSEKDKVELFAWCLMDNHVHILVKADASDLSKGFHRLATSYACYFNGRHDHVGPVFQDRFDSFPVETEEYLLMTMRYIHLNPLDTGIVHPEDYRWSSYGEYVSESRLCNTSVVLSLLGGKAAFVEFCDPSKGREYLISLNSRNPHLSEAEAKQIAISHLGTDFADQLAMLNRSERNRALHRLKASGLSVRQIERLTGIGRNIVARA